MKTLLMCSTFMFITLTSLFSFACTINSEPFYTHNYTSLVSYKDMAVPSNFQIFYSEINTDWLRDSMWEVRYQNQPPEPLVLEMISENAFEVGPYRLETSRWKPTDGLVLGSQIRWADCGSCGWYTIVGEDTKAPLQPKITLSSLNSVPLDDCTLDSKTSVYLNVEHEEEPAEESLTALIYMDSNARKTRETPHLRMVKPLFRGNKLLHYELSRLAGDEVPFCVAIELEDGAGNRSPRSEAICSEATENKHESEDMGTMVDMGHNSAMEPSGPMEGGIADMEENPSAEPPELGCSFASPSHKYPAGAFVFLLSLFGLLHRRYQRLPNL